MSGNEDQDNTNVSQLLEPGKTGIDLTMGTGAKAVNKQTSKKRDNMYQFVEWNFQKRKDKNKKERLRKDHPSFPIIMKLLERVKSGKDIKDAMPVKSASRYIYNIYMGKASEYAAVKTPFKKGDAAAEGGKTSVSRSPDRKAKVGDKSASATVIETLKKSFTSVSPSARPGIEDTIDQSKNDI